MKICVTGACGFIGLNLVKKLHDLGHEIVSIDESDNFCRLYGNDYWNNQPILDYTDIYKSKNYNFLKKVDFVFHLGANSSTRATYNELLIPNIKFSIELLEKCHELKIPVVFSSSASVIPAPLTHYANSKYYIENHIQEMINNKKSEIVYLRYFNVYGSNESHKGEMASIITKWIDNHFKGIEVNNLFIGSDKIKRDFIHVDDINNANILMLDYWEKYKHLPNTFHGYNKFEIGTGTPVSFQQVANEIIKLTKGTINYIPNPYSNDEYQFFTKAKISVIAELYEQVYNKQYKTITINKGIKRVFKDKMLDLHNGKN